MSRLVAIPFSIAGLCLLAACGAPEPGEGAAAAAKGPPQAEFAPMEKQQGADVTNDATRLVASQDGERMFLRRCGVCHLEGGMGTMVLAGRLPGDQAKLQNRRDLEAETVTTVVREGLGTMPRMTRVDVTDAELRAIAAYLARPRP